MKAKPNILPHLAEYKTVVFESKTAFKPIKVEKTKFQRSFWKMHILALLLTPQPYKTLMASKSYKVCKKRVGVRLFANIYFTREILYIYYIYIYIALAI